MAESVGGEIVDGAARPLSTRESAGSSTSWVLVPRPQTHFGAFTEQQMR